MRELTLLTGLNGMGKSSVIQAMLALRQSFETGVLNKGELATSGAYIDLGSVSDVLFEGAEKDEIEIAVRTSEDPEADNSFLFDVSLEKNSARAADFTVFDRALKSLVGGAETPLISNSDSPDRPEISTFHYLCAERNGPRKYLPMSRARADALELGCQGEFVLHALQVHGEKPLLSPDDRRLFPEAGSRLGDQVEAWLGAISPGVRLSLTPVPDADLIVGAFSFGQSGMLRSRNYRATNVGFGLSYVLPVLVALLATPKGGLVIIENPEAHMHPQGQTKLGELCARAAASGVQVVIESHSDHLMDGMRIAIREGLVSNDSVIFHYFSRRDGVVIRNSPAIDQEGRVSEWPEGFFDQHRRNAASLIRPKLS